MGLPEPKVIDLVNDGEYQPLLGGAPVTCGMRSGRPVIAPGADCGEHSTKEHEEVLVVLSGAGKARLGNGTELSIRGGQIVYIPPRTEHNIVNTGQEPLSYVYVVAPVAGL